MTETLPGCRLQQDAQHLAQIENQVSQQQSAAVSSGQRLDPNPNDDLGGDGETDQGVAVEEFPGGAWWASGKWRCHMLPYAYKNYKDYRTCMI